MTSSCEAEKKKKKKKTSFEMHRKIKWFERNLFQRWLLERKLIQLWQNVEEEETNNYFLKKNNKYIKPYKQINWQELIYPDLGYVVGRLG